MLKADVPRGVRLLSWATAVRWFGWGLFESLLPVFLFSFAHSYAETGILQSVYHIVFILALPVVGLLADKISSRTIILLGLLTYPFLSVSYFLAGVTGIALFIVIARVLNGIGYAFDGIGRDTYLRAHTPAQSVSTAFGYVTTVTHFGWMLAVIASLFIIPFVKIHWLFLAIIPTTLVTIAIVATLAPDHREKLKDGFRKALRIGFYSSMFQECKKWNPGMRSLAVLTFFLGIIATVGEFFLPIYAYTQGASLQQVILISIVLNIPELFGAPLGKLADKGRTASIFAGLGMIILLLVILATTESYVWQLAVALGMGVALQLLEVAGDGITTHLTKRGHYGRLSSAMEGLNDLGNIAGPIVLGILIDAIGAPRSFLLAAIVTLLLLCFIFTKRTYFSHKINSRRNISFKKS